MKVQVKFSGAADLSAKLAEMDRNLSRKIGRAGVAAMGNEIRNAAKSAASAQGLNRVGPGTLPSGKEYNFRGSIPKAIQARVLRKQGSKFKGVVYVRTRKGKGNATAPHWHWLEFGSIHNVPKPFLRPAIMSRGEKAILACVDVVARWIDRANRGNV